MVETATRAGFTQLSPTEDGIKVLKELAFDSFERISSHQFSNGLIPASLGRFDDEYFKDMVWVKDNVRAVKSALDPLVQQYLPELNDLESIKERGLTRTAKELYLSAIQGLLIIQAQPEQQTRFASRPGPPDKDGYSTISDDQLTPAIKFHGPSGSIYYDWGHNQPDNWATLLLEAGKGIEVGWPVLASVDEEFIPGDILQRITSYLARLRVERFKCRSLWERGEPGWSSYSTRRMALPGLEQMARIWPELVQDSHLHGYPLLVSRDQIEDAAGTLRDKVTEHFPADYTDSRGHESVGDLASLVVLNDIDLPADEQAEILRRVADLENNLGFYRYLGDPWKIGRAEAKWGMGIPIMARYFFKQAIRLYGQGNERPAFRALDHGLERMNRIIAIKREYAYFPELHEDRNNNGIYLPNNNELAWALAYINEAAAAGIAAITTSGLLT